MGYLTYSPTAKLLSQFCCQKINVANSIRTFYGSTLKGSIYQEGENYVLGTLSADLVITKFECQIFVMIFLYLVVQLILS